MRTYAHEEGQFVLAQMGQFLLAVKIRSKKGSSEVNIKTLDKEVLKSLKELGYIK